MLKKLFYLFVSLLELFIIIIFIPLRWTIKNVSLAIVISCFFIVLRDFLIERVQKHELFLFIIVFPPMVFLFDIIGLMLIFVVCITIALLAKILDIVYLPIINLLANTCTWIYRKCKWETNIQKLTGSAEETDMTKVTFDIEKVKIKLQRSPEKRGKAIIFNHNKYFQYKKFKERFGTLYDKISLTKVLEELNYDVHPFDDLKIKQILSVIKEVSKLNHDSYDSLIVVIMTHGCQYGVEAYDDRYTLNMIFDNLKPALCPSLVDKPKIFFIQACQGNRRDSGVRPSAMNNPIVLSARQNQENVPSLLDFFVARSSYNGMVSFRDPDSGSLFIQEVVNVLKKGVDLNSALTLVMNHIARNESDGNGDKQMPTLVSTLTKKFKF